MITCPRCGNNYVGTSTHGKLRRYRYYTCFSRTRYGTAGCGGIDADLLDQAIQQALIDFYSRTDIIDAAVSAVLAHRAEGEHQREEELKAVTGQITTTQAAIDRYLTAFENGTLDERACGHRVRDLTVKLDQLRTRRDELTEQTATPIASPSPRAIQQLRDDLAAVFAHGTPGQRKAVIETHVAAIKIDGNQTGPAETSTDPGVRTTHQRSVGPSRS